MALAGYYGVVFAAGSIGQDVSSGTLQLLLARPVTRPQYVVNRWLGAGLLATAWHTTMLAFGVLVLLSTRQHVDAIAVLRAWRRAPAVRSAPRRSS
jgi:ABC-type transport system involved in multi-copper enzyme maturation permease subunit